MAASSSSSSFNEGNFEKRLVSVNNTQECIQTLSLWCVHHKAHYKKIIDVWFKVFKKVKLSHRLALFYLANDVIQNSRRKGCAQYLEAWKPIIKRAVPYVRDEDVRGQIERIFAIWENRSVYDATFIKDLQAVIGGHAKTETAAATTSSIDTKILTEFKPQKLVDRIRKFKKVEAETEGKQKQFCGLKIDVCSTETLKNLKDKSHGQKFKQEFEEATIKLEEFVNSLQRDVKERTALLEMLNQSEVYYETQKKEVKIVGNAYKNFGSRVKNLKLKLEEFSPNLPSPIPSPSIDAPSPVDSSVEGSPAKNDNKDNTEAVDMEMSDEEIGKDTKLEVQSPGSAPSPDGSPVGLDLSPKVKGKHSTHSSSSNNRSASSSKKDKKPVGSTVASILAQITKSTTKPTTAMSTTTAPKSSASSLDIRLSNLMQNIPNFTSNLFGGRPNFNNSNEAGGGTPVKDEESGRGSVTPLLDESREARKDFNKLRVSPFTNLNGMQFGQCDRDDRAVMPVKLHFASPSTYNTWERDKHEMDANYASACLLNTFDQRQLDDSKISQSKDNAGGGGTPTLGDILQKLVSTGSTLNIPSQPSTPNWNSPQTQHQQQQWFNQNQMTPSSRLSNVRQLSVPDYSRQSGPIFMETGFDQNQITNVGGQFQSSHNGDGIQQAALERLVRPNSIGYRRNSNIVELTPSPTRGSSFDPSPTRGPSFDPSPTRGPSFDPASTRGPSFDPASTRGPSFDPASTRGPSFDPAPTRGPSFDPSPTRGPPPGFDANAEPLTGSNLVPLGRLNDKMMRRSEDVGISHEHAFSMTQQIHRPGLVQSPTFTRRPLLGRGSENEMDPEFGQEPGLPNIMEGSTVNTNLRMIVPVGSFQKDDKDMLHEQQRPFSKIETVSGVRETLIEQTIEQWETPSSGGNAQAEQLYLQINPTQGWHSLGSPPSRREAPPYAGAYRGFRFPRRVPSPRRVREWNPLSTAPKRPLLSSIRPRWANNAGPPF